MKLKNISLPLLTFGLLAALAVNTALAKDKLEAKAKVSKPDAEKIALAKVPGGKVKSSELEEENGKLIWSFDIATKGSKDITEIAVDAITGEIVDVAIETPADQAKEEEADAAEAKAQKDASKNGKSDETEVKITMDKVPVAVQQAVKAYATDAEIKGIEESAVDGTKVIEFDIEKNGKASEIAFRPNGKLFRTEEEVALTDCPRAVHKTIAEISKGAKAGKLEKVVQEGNTSYEITMEQKGEKTEYTISPAGKVTDKEEIEEKGKKKEGDEKD